MDVYCGNACSLDHVVEPCASDYLWVPPPPTFGDRRIRRAAADAILGVFIFSMTKKGHQKILEVRT